MTVGRVAVEKNLEAFLALNLPGSKVVIGDGPQKAELQRRYPKARFLGEKTGADLTAHLAAADVFVFPSLTDTFGVVQLEALACGTPVAAFPVTGPLDVIADHPVGALDADLRSACIRALGISRETCRSFALERSWENSARQFIGNLTALQPSRSLRTRPPRGEPSARARLSMSIKAKPRVIRRVETAKQRAMIMAEIAKLRHGALDFDRETVEQAYDRWAPVYDLVFGGVFSKGRRRPFRPPTRLAVACSRSASAPESRCRNTHRICASSAPIFRKRC